jgi:ERCC4-related helicase
VSWTTSVVLLVLDEAHKSVGKSPYATVTQAIFQANPYFRVLGEPAVKHRQRPIGGRRCPRAGA